MTFAYSEDAFLESFWESRTECDYDEDDAVGYWALDDEGDDDEGDDDEGDEYGDSDYGPGGDSCSHYCGA